MSRITPTSVNEMPPTIPLIIEILVNRPPKSDRLSLNIKIIDKAKKNKLN